MTLRARRPPTSERSSSHIGLAEPPASASRPLVGREREVAKLQELLTSVRSGGSVALLVCGEPGVGKSALLEHLVASATDFQVVKAAGVEGEVDLPYAGLHQLCRSMTETIGVLPQPQRDALHVAFGLTGGDPTNRYLVGLAALSLMSEVARTRPLLCVVDDAQWLDSSTTHALGFVARRLGADSVGLVLATRAPIDDLHDLPELGVHGLGLSQASALLDSVLVGRLDGSVRERLLAEAHGNPLALIELPRTLTPAELTERIRREPDGTLSAQIEESFRRRLEPLPASSRQLLVLAAAEPLGDPLLLFRAAESLGIGVEAVDAASGIGLVDFTERVTFCHPLARSAAYRAAAPEERRSAHGALAEATDRDVDPDRCAWHRAQATVAPDEELASELERTAERARTRGGVGASAVFLDDAVRLTPDPSLRIERALAAAAQKFDAGALDDADRLLRAVVGDQADELQQARAERLRAKVVYASSKDSRDAVYALIRAARRLFPVDPELGRQTLFEASCVARWNGDRQDCLAVAQAVEEHPDSGERRPRDLLLRGWARLLNEGYPAGTDLLTQGMIALRDQVAVSELEVEEFQGAGSVATALWDFESSYAISDRVVRWARETGALTVLRSGLDMLATAQIDTGDFAAARASLEEIETVLAVTGSEQLDDTWVLVHAWCDDEAFALDRIETLERQLGEHAKTEVARALLYNGLGRYDRAQVAAQRSCDLHQAGGWGRALVELVEAAARCGDAMRAATAFEQLAARTRQGGTDWALGLEARAHALLVDGDAAEALYRQSIELLGRTRLRPDLARAHLVYGEWLRRENRRVDARNELRRAHELFSGMGAAAFTDRAARELAATGETARKRTDDTRADLTAQESLIARLAAEGLTNPEIGAKLFLSPRTVEWHLRRVYPKLGISSRKELRTVLRTA